MSTETYNLAILLTIKDAASGGIDRFSGRLRAAAKEGKDFHKAYEQIKNDLSRDIAIGGVGIAGLVGLKKGIDSAATYEDALFDLRKAFQENAQVSGRSFEQQEQDFRRLTALATEMGGQLAGSSKDYIQIFTALNKSGVDATATINGTGKAVSYLANVTGALRKGNSEQLAEDFGSFVKMFGVKGEKELMRMVDMFAAIDDRFNLQSSNLIEGAKYFALTANDAMQLKGFEGAAETMKLMAFMKRFTAREGSIAGTSLDNLIGQYLAHGKKLEALKKQHNISIDFYDEKGQFKGATPEERVKTLFTELEKLQQLNPKERATWTKEIFGEVGFEAATAISSQGLKGYEVINTEMAKSVDVTKQINQQMDTYNAKVEALTGSWENFKASAFTPLMQDAKTFVDYGSKIANSLQSFSANNQGLMETLGTIALYGSTALVAYSGIKTLAGGFKLLSFANKFSRSEGLLPYLTGINSEINKTTTRVAGFTRPLDVASTRVAGFARPLETATTKAEKFKGTLQGIAGSSALKIGVDIGAIVAAEIALSTIIQRLSEAAEQSQKLAENSKIVKQVYDELAGRGLTYNKHGDFGGRQDLFDKQATEFLNSINTRQLEVALAPDRKTWSEFFADTITPTINPYPYSNKSSEYFSPELAAKKWSKSELTQPLHDPNILARTIAGLHKLQTGEGENAKKFSLEQIDKILKTFEILVGKEKFATAQKIVKNEHLTDNKTTTIFGETKQFQAGVSQQPMPPISAKSFQVGSLQNSTVPFLDASRKPNRFQLPEILGQRQPTLKPINQTVESLFNNKPFSVKPTSLASLGLPDFSNLTTNTNTLSASFAELSRQQNQQTQNNEAVTSFSRSLLDFQTPFSTTKQYVGDLGDASSNAVKPIEGLMSAALRISGGLNNVGSQLANWKAPTPQIQTFTIGVPAGTSGSPVVGIIPPPKASGGTVLREGLVYVHQGEDIMPASVTSQYRKPQTLAESVGYKPKKDIFSTIENHFKNSSVSGNRTEFLNQIASNINSFAVQNLNPTALSKPAFSREKSPLSVMYSRSQNSSDKTSPLNPYFQKMPNLSIIEESREREANFERIPQSIRENSQQPITINYNPTVNVSGGTSAKKDAALAKQELEKEFLKMLNKHQKELDYLVARGMQNGRIRA